MKLALILLLLPTLAFGASEAQIACSLEKAQAEVQATTLAAPAAFASVGDPTSAEKTVILGVTQSLSGRSRADTIRQAATAKCDALQATLQLDEQAKWSLAQIQRDSAEQELRGIDDAIGLAAVNLALLDQQLEAKTITIIDHTAARTELAALEQHRADLKRIVAITVLPAPKASASELIARAQRQEANAAALTAKANADGAWDVTVSTGMRQPISGGNATPFVAMTAKYSFGLEASRQAARDVGKYTQQLMQVQQSGYAQTDKRQSQDVDRLIVVERASASSLHNQLDQLQRIYASLHGLDTALALNTARSLEIQMKALQAQIAGTEARQRGYEALLQTLQ